MTAATETTVAAVVIGRNEGERLRNSLTSLKGQVERIVYVDSGSRDDSVSMARGMVVEVVELDRSRPFTAARGRNAGFAALKAQGLPDYVQFVDGDCGLAPGWIAAARAALDQNPDLGLVTGWRSEVAREASVYNQMADVEWHRPAGDILACGGDMMVRSAAFEAVGGFDPSVIAAEDDEFCVRLRGKGFRLHRLPLAMTFHDADMMRFSQFWQRNVRSGHGFFDVGSKHPDHFRAERRRVWQYAIALPILVLSAAFVPVWLSLLALLAFMGLGGMRTFRGLHATGQPKAEAGHHAVYYTLAKLPQLQGMITYYWRRLRGRAAELIEYK